MTGKFLPLFFRKPAFASDQQRIDWLGFKCCIGIEVKYSTLWVFIEKLLQTVTIAQCHQIAPAGLFAGADKDLLQSLL